MVKVVCLLADVANAVKILPAFKVDFHSEHQGAFKRSSRSCVECGYTEHSPAGDGELAVANCGPRMEYERILLGFNFFNAGYFGAHDRIFRVSLACEHNARGGARVPAELVSWQDAARPPL